MITSIRGIALAVGPGYITFEQGGFGVRVEVPAGTRAPKLHAGDQGVLHTEFIVREDSLTLYGFETEDELEVFQLLLKVNGVGPRSALGVLSTLTPSEIAVAASTEDEKVFKKVSGIGPKTAKLLIISLNGKLDHLTKDLNNSKVETKETATNQQVILGLVGIGWNELAAKQAVANALELAPESSTPELMKQALKLLQAPKKQS